MSPHPLTTHGRPLAAGRLPAVCAPLVARDCAGLLREAQAVAAKQPDLMEWRVDFFAALADKEEVLATGEALRQCAGGIPLLFTRPAQREGGEPIALDEAGVVALYEAVCAQGQFEFVDFEMSNAAADLERVRAAARAAGIGLVLSFHDFRRTPAPEELLEHFRQAERLGADAAKVAVMPQAMEDVHALLGATLQASRELRIPVISMAMGPLGAASRVCGGVFGSALTFAVGAAPSAPGQMPIEDVRAALEVLRRAAAATPG